MKLRTALLFLIAAIALSGCRMLHPACRSGCHSEARASSSLVSFLYPGGRALPRDNAIPQLNLPVRVGLAFLPAQSGSEPAGLDAAHREQILERVRQHFAARKFVSEIVIVPDYYLRGSGGFESLQGVQRLYDVDVMALISYDQVTWRDDNAWSLGYLTIVGAYVLKGNRHDVTTLMDLAVVDPISRSLLLRAGGTDDRHGRTTLVNESQGSRQSGTESFGHAADRLIENFDGALTRFEADVRAGKANVRVANRNAAAGGGAGALDAAWLVLLASVVLGYRSATARRARLCAV